MSFKRKSPNEFEIWRNENRRRLILLGVPDVVVDDLRRWNHLLNHGFDPESRWCPDWISLAQAEALLRLIQSRYGETQGIMIYRDLKNRIVGMTGKATELNPDKKPR